MRVLKYLGIAAVFSVMLTAQDVKMLRIGSVPESKILHKVQPMYPPEAADHHIQGVVKLSVTIGANGRIEHLKLISGHPLLAPAAMQAVRRWVFEPFQSGDQNVRVMTEIEIPFRLDGAGNPVTPKL